MHQLVKKLWWLSRCTVCMYVKISVTVKIFSSITTTNIIKCSGFIKIKFPCYGQSPSIHNDSGTASERRKQLRKWRRRESYPMETNKAFGARIQLFKFKFVSPCIIVQFKSPTRCNNFPVYFPDVYLQLDMFRAFTRTSSGAQWLQ